MRGSKSTTFFGKVNFELDEKKHTIVDGRNPAPYDTYRVSYIPGGAGFQPSTVGVSKLLCTMIAPDEHLSHEQYPGWLGYRGDEILPSFINKP